MSAFAIPADFQDALANLLSIEDMEMFNAIQKEGTDADKLLSLQFLLQQLPRLEGLAIILIPFLKSHPNSDELVEPLLDAMVGRSGDTNYLDLCIDTCQVLTPQMTCRVLVRLQQLYPIQDALLEVLLNDLSNMATWLLPLLYNADAILMNSQQTARLWARLWEQTDPLVVSAVLCTILPFLLDTPLPTQRPIHQAQLWDFLYSSLQPSDDIALSTTSGRGAVQVSTSQTLRRRALYILRLLVEHNPPTIWNVYVACFETLEMETEPHLVDQVWDSVGDVCRAVHDEPCANELLPPMTWDWIAAMLCRLLLADTPVLRKLACYRLFGGSAGIHIGSPEEEEVLPKKVGMTLPKKKHSIKSKKGGKMGAPLSIVSCNFVLDAMLPSYDTLGTSIGTNMQFEENGKIKSEDMIPKSYAFIMEYVRALPTGERIKEFMTGIFSQRTLCRLRTKTALSVYRAVAQAVMTRTDVVVDEAMISTAISSFSLLFSAGSVVVTFRQGLLESFARILSCSQTEGTVDPKVILKVLMLYPMDDSSFGRKQADKIRPLLQTWLTNMMGPSAMSTIGSSCAAAFVTGQLLPPSTWDVRTGNSDMERDMGAAIVLLCALSTESMLWPAIHKALSGMPPLPPIWHNAGKASRSLILLEHGCRMEILSGVGNGDLVVDRKTQQMMPPPPNIEAMLSNGVTFLVQHVKTLTSATVDKGTTTGGTRCGTTNRISNLFANLISQLKVLHEAYPSSSTVSEASDELYRSSIVQLFGSSIGMDSVTFTALSFAALSCGANPLLKIDGVSTASICTRFLQLEFSGADAGMSKTDEQAARSMFHCARWGALSCILPSFLDTATSTEPIEILEELLTVLFEKANDLVQATPVDALLPLFDCVIVGANSWLATGDIGSTMYSDNLGKIIASLFDIMADVSNSETSTYMLNAICGLIFRPRLLIDEAERLEHDNQYAAPIRAAFHRLVEMAGTNRSFISKAVLCRMCGAWLGFETTNGLSNAGVGAIPYRQDLIKLLVQKGVLIDESSTNQSILQSGNAVPEGAVELPSKTSESSISRGFVLVFLSRLPNASDGIGEKVVSELLHYLIIHLLDDVCLAAPKGGAMIVTGSEEYSRRTRAWQALCLLSRFVSGEIAEQVCNKLFKCISQNLHGQIRYFLEVFTMQCARQHPSVFAKRLVMDIQRYDLTLQHISTLMIIAGNLIVGQHRLEFFSQFDDEMDKRCSLKEVLSGTIPWLSSTQGFTRCIAQLLVHELIPMVVDVTQDQVNDKDWYLRTLFSFLENNSEMKRLRTKQQKFFDGYDCDTACTAEGLMSISVDESDEANPLHLVDAVKNCLEEIYLESHEEDAPVWKQIEEMTVEHKVDHLQKASDGNVNFQRKIIPLDSLGLALEESRDKQLRNASGRKRQQLIVCASLIDKVPNLAGLARTAEIFAAERLVVPDISVCKMDNFKSISVGAGEWIKIEECKEDVSMCSSSRSFLPDDLRHIQPRSVLSTF